MKNNTVLYILLIVLIVMNGFFLFNFIGRPEPLGPRESGSMIAKELRLNETQLEAFKALEEKHHKTMETYGEAIKKDKDALFNQITAPQISEAHIDSLIGSISKKETLIEKEMFYKLRAVYKLCNDEQKKRLNDIMTKVRGPGPEGDAPKPGRR